MNLTHTTDYLRHDDLIQTRSRIVADLLGPLHGVSILDVGCGDGRISLQFLGGNRLVLLDPSPDMLERAVHNAPRSTVEFVSGELGVPLGAFDVVLCLGVLAHVPTVATAVRQLAEATRDRLVVQITDSHTPLGLALTSYGRMHRPLNRTTLPSLERMASTYGLQRVRTVRYSGRPPYPLTSDHSLRGSEVVTLFRRIR